MPTLIEQTTERESYRAGSFVYTAEDQTVLVTKDARRSILTVAFYRYKNHEVASDAAWKMACRQMRA